MIHCFYTSYEIKGCPNVLNLVHIYNLMKRLNYLMCLLRILLKSKRSVNGNNAWNSVDMIENNDSYLMAAFQQIQRGEKTIITSGPNWFWLSMMTSSNGNIFRVTGLCARNSSVTGEFHSQRPVTRLFDVLFDLRLNKRLSKHSCGWWFETPSCSLWRHCNG